MTFQRIAVYLTVLLQQFLTTQTQFLQQGQYPFPPGAPAMPMQLSSNPMQGMPGMQVMPPSNMPMRGHMQGPVPMPYPMPQSRLPVVVMPYYSKSKTNSIPKYKKSKRKHIKKHRFYDSDSDDMSDSSDSSIDFSFRAAKRNKKIKGQRRRQVLTPVVSYVTKEGYVVYQKKIKKDRAKDWLEMGKRQMPSTLLDNDGERNESLESFQEAKKRYRFSRKSSNNY